MLTIAKAAPADPSQALPPYTQQEEQPIGGAANPAVSMTGEQSTRSAFTTARFNHDLPQINAQIGDLQILTDLALDALLEANRSRPYIFNLGGSYVRIEELPADDRRIPSVAILTPAKMKYELARVAHWVRIKNGEIFDTQPPARTVTDVLAVPSPPLPILSRVVQVPVFSSNGRLETTPGYHAGSQTYYWPKQGVALLPVSEHPSAEEVSAAKRLLLDDLLADFPFETEADRAHAVALALLPYARNLIFGPPPTIWLSRQAQAQGRDCLQTFSYAQRWAQSQA